MDDEFLYSLHADPPAQFAERLRARLARREETVSWTGDGWRLTWRIGGAAAAAMLLGLLFTFPTVRASAQAFLDLFRVINFTAVPVEPARISRLSGDDLGLRYLIGEQVEMLRDPGKARRFATPELAGAAAGIGVRLPEVVPAGLVMTQIEVEGERAMRVTGDTFRLRQLLDTLEIRDLSVPETLNGQTATLRVLPIVRVTYGNGGEQMDFFQGQSPEVSLPAGVDLAGLGEIALRILGLERGEAHRLAQAIDWRSTLIVPVPAHTTAFRQVEVQGNRGLLMRAVSTSQGREVASNMLVWSEGGYVYGMTGRVGMLPMLEMANSLR